MPNLFGYPLSIPGAVPLMAFLAVYACVHKSVRFTALARTEPAVLACQPAKMALLVMQTLMQTQHPRGRSPGDDLKAPCIIFPFFFLSCIKLLRGHDTAFPMWTT
ncbi:hypothetical protein Vretifemale_11426 [Volvox reticuliferus]|uniref:Uncharacterized protein n=1 Tax=Volvox reticuliferus TaxID=1737510 RepID=A0A8J4FNI1_9CHLO|nr:hypothetical protein Vretifemale_11426 [Volvox reticuliferus]